MSALHYACAAVCPPLANMGAAEFGALTALVVILLASAFWPSRSA